jgi:hypothetical protein
MSQRFAGRTPERANGDRATLRSTAPKKPRVPRKAKSDAAAQTLAQPLPSASPAQPAPPPPTQLKPQAPTPVAAAAAKSADDKPKQDNGGAQIVRLDAFRKK